ncbi:hypothetical protein B0H13DRAFT_1872094 [Mycena leptocephala]|nr:hypothetical protein B0H13DRAFT_1872094 [Mycena leptocephala]
MLRAHRLVRCDPRKTVDHKEIEAIFKNQGHGAKVQSPALQRVARGVDQYSGIIFNLVNEDLNCSRKMNRITTQLENCMYYAQALIRTHAAEGCEPPSPARAKAHAYSAALPPKVNGAAGRGRWTAVHWSLEGNEMPGPEPTPRPGGVEFDDEKIIDRNAECGTSQLPNMRRVQAGRQKAESFQILASAFAVLERGGGSGVREGGEGVCMRNEDEEKYTYRYITKCNAGAGILRFQMLGVGMKVTQDRTLNQQGEQEKESERKIDVDFDTNRKRQRIGKQELGDTVTEGVEKRDITQRHEGIGDERQCPTARSLQPGGIDGVYGAESKGRAGMGISSRREDTERRWFENRVGVGTGNKASREIDRDTRDIAFSAWSRGEPSAEEGNETKEIQAGIRIE